MHALRSRARTSSLEREAVRYFARGSGLFERGVILRVGHHASGMSGQAAAAIHGPRIMLTLSPRMPINRPGRVTRRHCSPMALRALCCNAATRVTYEPAGVRTSNSAQLTARSVCRTRDVTALRPVER